jgi:hypothetical protein
MHWTITTLHEYRTLYPDSAAIPTLKQSGLLGLLLDRQRYKAAKLARRQARWKSICATPRNVCVSIWRALTAGVIPRDRLSSISPGLQILSSPDPYRPTSKRADIGSRRQS